MAGDAVVVNGLRRRSNRKISEEEKAKATRIQSQDLYKA